MSDLVELRFYCGHILIPALDAPADGTWPTCPRCGAAVHGEPSEGRS